MFLFFIVAGCVLALALWGTRGKSATPKLSEEEFVRKMKVIAAASNGTVTVFESPGHRGTPHSKSVTNLAAPAALKHGSAYLSAAVVIEDVHYGFHACVYPPAARYAAAEPEIYFAVTGPGNVDQRNGEFQIVGEDFKWTGERPWAPLLVKSVLREWAQTSEVQQGAKTEYKRLRAALRRS